MAKWLSLFFYLYLLAIICQSCNDFNHHPKLQLPKQQKLSCVDDTQHIISIQQSQEQHLRLLQTSTPHPFKIFGQFPNNTTTSIDINILKRMFRIATKYFQVVLQVTAISAANTQYPANGGTCGWVVPSNYVTNGFDQTQMDIVLFNTISNLTAETFVARAGACTHVRWPTYGRIQYNAAYIDTDLTKTGDFHSNAYVTMHEIGHILGVSSGFYNRFFGDYTSTTFLSNTSVLGTHSSIPGRSMIITPNVKTYVQSYFSCSDTSVGALIQQNGGSGSAGSHFQRIVYYDQMMTASRWNSGNKITPLTLNYLKDTGFYYSVDVTQAQTPYFGKGKGCNFALGLDTSTPQYCSGSSTGCGFYSQFSGVCSATDTFSSGLSYISPYSNLICTLPQNVRTSGPFSSDYVYDAMSRCFMMSGGTHGKCYQTTCTATSVQINVTGTIVTCTNSTTTVSSPMGTIICPTNIQQFCDHKACPNWCSNQGICLKGVCMLIQCSIAIDKCLNCTVDTLNRCQQCQTGYMPSVDKLTCIAINCSITNCASCSYNGALICDNCSATFYNTGNNSCNTCGNIITSCITCSYNGTTTLCDACSSGLVPSANKLSCIAINCTITNCATCSYNVTLICETCNGGFYHSTNNTCDTCANLIVSCTTCVDSNKTTLCTACGSGLVPSANGLTCQNASCSTITNCINCTMNGTLICSGCAAGFFLVNNTCITCAVAITNCNTCIDTNGIITCSICNAGTMPSANSLTCVTINCNITNCATCSYNGTLICNSCNVGFYNTGSNSCDTCGNTITSCTSCTTNGTTTLCNLCSSGLMPAANQLSCVAITCTITNCATCSYNGTLICDTCNGGFYHIGNACDTCVNIIPNCVSCSETNKVTTCSACVTNYFIGTGSSICNPCSSLISNCSTCVTSSLCGTCSTGFYLTTTNQSCLTCPQLIVDCVSCNYNLGTKCIGCFTGMYPVVGNTGCAICQLIIANCISCLNNAGTTQCNQCNNGYFLSGFQCLICSSICKTCLGSSTTCTSCFDGYYLASNNTCLQIPLSITSYAGTCIYGIQNVPCQRGCLVCQCISLTSTPCVHPMEGYAIMNGTVVKCSDGCSACISTNSSSCTACSSRYALQGTLCAACHSSCSSCSPTNASVCLTCPQTYQLNTQNQCSRCTIANCKQCSSMGTCIKCVAGYSIISNGLACDQCMITCSICDQTNITNCLQCTDTFYLLNNTCVNCPQGCLTCVGVVCSSCVNGYTINVTTSKCIKDCQFPCLTCLDTNQASCTSCLVGYNFNSTAKTCIAVLTCSGVCTNCPFGYQPSGTSCTACFVSNCATCKSQLSICDNCKIGYYLSNNTCPQCQSTCAACIDIDRCLKCKSGYTKVKQNSVQKNIIQGKCYACQSPCKTCQKSINRCLSCLSGYIIDGWKCILQYRVTFIIKLNTDYRIFIQNSRHKDFRTNLLKLLGKSFSNTSLFTIRKMREGSTQITGDVGNPTDNTVPICDQSKTMQSNLATGQSIQGTSILQSTITASGGQTSCPTSTGGAGDNNSNLILIVALSAGIPAGIIGTICIKIALIIIGVVIHKITSGHKKVKTEQGSTQYMKENRQFTQIEIL